MVNKEYQIVQYWLSALMTGHAFTSSLYQAPFEPESLLPPLSATSSHVQASLVASSVLFHFRGLVHYLSVRMGWAVSVATKFVILPWRSSGERVLLRFILFHIVPIVRHHAIQILAQISSLIKKYRGRPFFLATFGHWPLRPNQFSTTTTKNCSAHSFALILWNARRSGMIVSKYNNWVGWEIKLLMLS